MELVSVVDLSGRVDHTRVAELRQLDLDLQRHALGYTDLCDSLAGWQGAFDPSPYRTDIAYLAHDGGQVVGGITATLLTQEETDLAYLMIGVQPEHRRRGIGALLLARLEDQLHAQNRHTLQLRATSRGVPADHPDALAAKTGQGTIDRTDPTAAFLLGHGFELEQAERHATLTLTDWPALDTHLQQLLEQARHIAGPDYELLTWASPADPHLHEQLAQLHSRFNADQPWGGLAHDDTTLTAQRIADGEERLLERGRSWVSTAIRHRPTRQLVALTDMQWPTDSPVGVWQGVTIVLAAHRGHRLGLLSKAANIQQLHQASPGSQRIHTWNAAENHHMIGINNQLGFTEQGWNGAWQKTL